MSSFGKKIAIGALWTTADSWGRQATNFAVFTLLAWLLGPEAYGFVALALVVPLILAAPVTRGLPEAIVQRAEIDGLHLDSAFWLLVGAGAALTALIAALAAPIAWAFEEPQLAGLIRWASLLVVLVAVASVPGAVLKRDLDFRLFALRSLAGTLAGGAVGIGMALTGFEVWSLVGQQLAKALVEAVVLLVGGNWRPRLRFSMARCRDLFPFARPIVVQSFVTLVNDESPKVVIGFFLGPHAVGIYVLARRILELMTEVLLAPLFNLALPSIARVQNEPAKIDRFIETTVRLTALVGCPAFVGLAAVAPDVVPSVFGPDWAPAALVVQVMMLLGLQRTFDGIYGATLLALGHSMLLLQLNLAFAVMTPVLVATGAQFGTAAAVAGLVAGNLILLPVMLMAASRLVRIDVAGALAIYPRVLFATLAMALVVTAWRVAVGATVSGPVLIVSSVLMGAASYGLALLVVARRDLIKTRDTLMLRA